MTDSPNPPAPTPSTEEADRGAERRRTDGAARERDPHGTDPAEVAAEDEPKGLPTSDRHRAETAGSRIKPEE